MGKADLHMHSTFSDGYATVARIVAFVDRSTDIDVIAITDHDCIDGALLARDLITRHAQRVQTIVGAEISTADGHLLALNIERLIPAGLSMQETILAVQEQGGLAVVAHPLSAWCPSASMDTLLGFEHAPDGLEVYNASWAGLGSNSKVRRVNARDFGWAELGGSDAHNLSAIGSSYSTFPGFSAEDALTAIRARTMIAFGRLWPNRALAHYTYRKVRSHIPTPRSVGRRLRGRSTSKISASQPRA